MTPVEKYAQVILHSGCSIPPKGEQELRKHKWGECRAQKFYLRIARKHQHKLQSNGLTIGTWARLKNFEDWCDCGTAYPKYGIGKYKHLPSCRYGIVEDFIDIVTAPVAQR